MLKAILSIPILIAALTINLGVAVAAPPIDPSPPSGLPETIDGYSVQPLYGLFSYWIEGQKTIAINTIMQKPLRVEGLEPQAPIFTFKKYNDYGHFLSGEVRPYCTVDLADDAPEGRVCVYRLRRVWVPVGVSDSSGAVVDFMHSSFSLQKVVSRLKAASVDPEKLWLADRDTMFRDLPSAVPVLTANATSVSYDSKSCPALEKAIKELEGTTIKLKVDMLGVGEDVEPERPVPHQMVRRDTLHFVTTAGDIELSGFQRSMFPYVGKLLESADACEKQQVS